MDDKIIDSDFEEIKDIFNGYITKGVSEQRLIAERLNGGALTGLRSKEIIDKGNQSDFKRISNCEASFTSLSLSI